MGISRLGHRAEEHRVLSTTTIVVWAVGLVVVAASAVILLWSTLGAGAPDTTRLDVIRTASSIVLGTGGAAALLLAARRQRATELDVKQKDHDATERRVTELYGKAADQLGSDKAPVRLAGLYALERLAQDNPAHRKTIVNLICAYLRMPFEPPREGRSEEWEVRQTAQSLLVTHLRPGEDATYWTGMELNLSGATLDKFVMTHCVLRAAQFFGATFVGPATFRGTTFERAADFRDARFLGLADFRRVDFGEETRVFRGAAFEGEVDFGTHTDVMLTGAITRTDREPRRKWPSGWAERALPDEYGWAALIPLDQQERSPAGGVQ